MSHAHIKAPTDDPVLADFLEANGYIMQAQQLRGMEPVLYLWLLTQDEAGGYDTYDSCIVAAYDDVSARRTYPCATFGPDRFNEATGMWECADGPPFGAYTWASSPDSVTATRIGVADGIEPGVVLASFNAG